MKTPKKRNWLVITLCVLLVCAIAGTVVSGIQFSATAGNAYASASVEFSFDSAADGIAPNGYPFTIADLTSDTVLEKALTSAGLAEKVTAADLRQQLKVSGVYPDNIVEQMTSYESLLDFSAKREVMATVYHPTQYAVTLENGFDTKLSREDLEKLLQSILDSYRAYFAEAYAAGKNRVAVDYTLPDLDYPQQLTVLSRLMEESAGYATEMYEKQPTLTRNGKGFNDIALRLRNLIDTEISRLSANVTINALTQRPRRLITQYQYEIDTLNNRLARKNDQLSKMDALLKFYDKYEVIYLSTTDSLTKIDGNSSETYDALVANHKQVADEITDIETSIDTYTQRLKDLTGETAETAASAETAAPAAETEEKTVEPEENAAESATESSAAEGDAESPEAEAATEEVAPSLTEEEIAAMTAAAEEAAKKPIRDLEADIEKLKAGREAVMQDFAALLQLYNDQQINDMTVSISKIVYREPSLFSGAFAKQVLKTAGPICVIGFMVCILLMIISRIREEKARKKA